MTVTVTVRPNGARTEIRGLPFLESGGNYRLLGEAIAATRRGQVLYSGGAFTVSRPHTVRLIEFLVARFGRVKVIQHGGLTKCVSECWNAKPHTVMTCECSCAGSNHGSGVAIGKVVSQSGPAGALSVQSEGYREYFVPE